jgi:hypothetical protein
MHRYCSGRRIHAKERSTYTDHRPSVDLARNIARPDRDDVAEEKDTLNGGFFDE